MTSPASPFGLCVSVPAGEAADALERLGHEGLRDHRYRVRQEGQRVLIPVEEGARAPEDLEEARLVEAELERDPRRPPIELVRERLADELDDAQLEALPTGWARLGEVLLLRLPETLEDIARTVAEAYARELDVDSVLHLEGSSGAWREPETRLLYGDEDTETVHREHGIAYRLDPRQVLFSPGNKTERHRLREPVEDTETVVDLFAGIGYFALPLAAEGATVVACEVNPTSVAFLRENAELNDLADRIEIREGDCRELAPPGVADRVLMGYLPGTDAYLDTAVACLKPAGGWIHYHDRAPRPDPLEHARARVRDHEALASREVHVDQAHVVKTLDPEGAHVCLDLHLGPEPEP